MKLKPTRNCIRDGGRDADLLSGERPIICVNMDANSASLLAALEVASGPNYLGNLSVVDGILRELALAALNRRATLPDVDAEKLNEADCIRLTNVFLGKNTTDYTPIKPWNSPGHIDRFVMREFGRKLGWGEGRPEHILKAMFAEFIMDFYRLADYAADPAVPEDNWNWQPDALFESYVGYLLGIIEPTD